MEEELQHQLWGYLRHDVSVKGVHKEQQFVSEEKQEVTLAVPRDTPTSGCGQVLPGDGHL